MYTREIYIMFVFFLCLCMYVYIILYYILYIEYRRTCAVTIRDGFNNPLKVVAYIRWLNGRLDVPSLICSIGRII